MISTHNGHAAQGRLHDMHVKFCRALAGSRWLVGVLWQAEPSKSCATMPRVPYQTSNATTAERQAMPNRGIVRIRHLRMRGRQPIQQSASCQTKFGVS